LVTQKTAKVDAEILKAKEKISELQNKLKELEIKKTDIENTEIVDIVRGMSIPLDGLAALLQSLKGGAIPPVPTFGQNVQRSKNTKSIENAEITEAQEVIEE